jgi:cation:H+ antiporter
MFLSIVAVLVGFLILRWSSDQFVEGAAAIARALGVSQIIIGMTIVSIGTSAPEIVVSIIAALDNAGNLAVGNAIGSNIANIGVVLGATLLVAPLYLQESYVKKEMPILLGVTLLGALVVINDELSRLDGIILVSALVLILTKMIRDESRDRALRDEVEQESLGGNTATYPWLRFVGGLILLVASSRLLVWGAVNIAHSMGVSELIIGLTIIAIGTSLPELAASVMSAKKGHAEIALGNVLGSNLFNLLAVLPVPGLLSTLVLDQSVTTRDYPVMFALTLLLGVAIYSAHSLAKKRASQARLGRLWGLVLLICAVCYYTVLIQATR